MGYFERGQNLLEEKEQTASSIMNISRGRGKRAMMKGRIKVGRLGTMFRRPRGGMMMMTKDDRYSYVCGQGRYDR